MKDDPDQKPKSAVALHYDQVHAPRVTAKGRGELAEQIIALALENNIPVREEPELVQLLSRIELGDEIPESLYVAVAEIIAFVYMLQGRFPGQGTGQQPKG